MMRRLILGALLALASCGFRAYRSPRSIANAPIEEKKPAGDCDGQIAAGLATVLFVVDGLPNRPPRPGRAFVLFDFTPISGQSRVQMTLSLTAACLAEAKLTRGVQIRTTAWMRTVGDCHPYVLQLPTLSCMNQQADEAE